MCKQALSNLVNPILDFRPEIQNRIDKITERLFTHGLWLNPTNTPILRSIYDEEIRKLFEKEQLDYIHLTRLD